MSQSGLIDVEQANPQIPTLFVANVGDAVPLLNTLEILGAVVAAHAVPLQTVGSGNTISINVQYASAAATSIAANAGVASFNSADFSVDANGFVSVSATAGATTLGVDTSTPPGTNPVEPDGLGTIDITGGQVAAGTTANVIQTNSLVANQMIIQIQRSSAQGSSTIGANGVSHFNSTFFTVDANGFVSINGSSIGETITGNTGGALSPTAGNWNILGTSTAAGTTPVQTAGAGSTLTVQVQKAQAIASTNATNVGLAAFNSAYFTVDSNGFVSISGTTIGQTITGNAGGALSPTAGNWNILGTSTAAGTTPVQTSGTGSTLTVQVQKAQAIASTNVTNVGLAAFDSARFSVDANGFVTVNGSGLGETITGNTGGALSPTTGNWNIVGTGSITTSGSGSTLTVQLTGLTNHNVLLGAGTSTVTNVPPSATSGIPFISQGSSADPVFGTAAIAGGGTNATTFAQTQGVIVYNGTSLVNYSGGPEISTAGYATNAAQPAWNVYLIANATNQTGDGTVATVPIATKNFDTTNSYNTGTFTYTFPVTGKYLICWEITIFNMLLANNAASLFALYNGGTVVMDMILNPFPIASGASAIVGVANSSVVSVAAGDTLLLQGQVAGGTKRVGYGGGTQLTSFSGNLIC